MKGILFALAVGLIFGAGLIVAGMTQPTKVVGFLDLLGGWDPSLAMVMVGAIAVHLVAYRFVPRLGKPLWSERFGIPTRKDVDRRLLIGAAMFGAGWGIAGYCPGPALTAVGTGAPTALLFTASMLFGMWAWSVWEASRS